MCLYNYNNKFQTNNILDDKEYELLSNIYQCIASNDTENVKKLTEQLIVMQSSKENIETLEDAIKNFK